jgi:hypothetical protein
MLLKSASSMKAACISPLDRWISHAEPVYVAQPSHRLTSLFSSQREVVRRPLIVQPVQASSSPLYVWHGSGSPARSVPSPSTSASRKPTSIKGGENLGWTYVATGRSGFNTPTGTFRILEKQADKRSNRYGSIVASNGAVLRSNATAGVHSARGGRFLGARCPTGCASPATASACMPEPSPILALPPPTAAFACPTTWRRRSTSTLRRHSGDDHALSIAPARISSNCRSQACGSASRSSHCLPARPMTRRAVPGVASISSTSCTRALTSPGSC